MMKKAMPSAQLQGGGNLGADTQSIRGKGGREVPLTGAASVLSM
jgi:hypothetical protein